MSKKRKRYVDLDLLRASKKRKRTEQYGPEEKFIVKFQRPQFGDARVAGMFLIYDEHRIIFQELAMTEDIDQLMGRFQKKYFVCQISERGLLSIHGEAKDTPWW